MHQVAQYQQSDFGLAHVGIVVVVNVYMYFPSSSLSLYFSSLVHCPLLLQSFDLSSSPRRDISSDVFRPQSCQFFVFFLSSHLFWMPMLPPF